MQVGFFLTKTSREIDKFGFGKYQWCIWLLCGFGYFLDLAWAQGVGLLATAIFQEMNVPADKQGLIFTCSNAGLAYGLFVVCSNIKLIPTSESVLFLLELSQIS